MSRLNYSAPAPFIVPINTAVSNNLALPKNLRALAIFGAAAFTNTITFGVSNDGGSTFQTLQSGGADVALAADKCVVIDIVAFTNIRLEASGNEAAARTVLVQYVEEI